MITNDPISPAQILARLSVVDGNFSGLDADRMRGANPDGTMPGSLFGGIPIAGQVHRSPHPGAVLAQSLFAP